MNRKIILTLVVIFLVFSTGFYYQYAYHQKRIRYEQIITGYYREYFHREPDAKGLEYWVTWAANRWGIEKVRRLGFEEAAKKGAV